MTTRPGGTWFPPPVARRRGPRVPVSRTAPTPVPEPTTTVSHIVQTDSSISFHVDRIGTPVEVKVSYFPNWKASGADGPWRAAPNLMVVVPTSHDVTLHYGSSPADEIGQAISLLAVVAAVALAVAGRRSRRSRTAVGTSRDPDRAVTTSRTLGMFPLSTVLFPGAGLPLHVFEARYRALMSDCLEGGGEFGVVLISRGSEVGGGDERVDVGTVARIDQVAELDDGRMLVIALGVRRFRVERWLEEQPYPRAVVEDLPAARAGDHGVDLSAAEASVRRLRSLLSELGDVPAPPHDLEINGSAEQMVWQLCELAPLNLIDRQELLASATLDGRLGQLAGLCDAMTDDVVAMLAGGAEF